MTNVISNWIFSDLNNDKLTEKNYDIWSCKVQLLLEDQELLEPLTHNMEPPPSVEDEFDMIKYQSDLEVYNAWKKKSRAARTILLISMRSDLMLRFDCYQTAKEVWDAVKGSFDRTPLVRMRQLQLCFDDYKMKSNHIVSEHIAAMSDMIHELATAGYVLTDEQQVLAMIKSLPEGQIWDLIRQKLTCDGSIQNFEDVARGLKIEGEKLGFKKPLNGAHEVQLESSPGQLKANGVKKRKRAQENQGGCNDQNNKKSKVRCFACRKSDHFTKDCTRVCFNCQHSGHLYQDCPEKKSQHCNEAEKTGYDMMLHQNTHLPSNDEHEKAKKEDLLCFVCRKRGHIAKDCKRACFNCQQSGHKHEDCPEKKIQHCAEAENTEHDMMLHQNMHFPSNNEHEKAKKENPLCYVCRKRGHIAKDCKRACFNCQQSGHLHQDCPEKKVQTPPNTKADKSEIYVAWTKPEKGWVKVNTDGAVREKQGLAAAGGVIRDENGFWVTGFVQNMDSCSVQMAEMWGVLHGLQLAWDRGFRQVIIEMDCNYCYTLLGQDVAPTHLCYNLLRQCQDYLRRDWIVQYRHIYREANRLADYMCTIAFSFPVGFHILNEPPLGSAPFVLDDIKGVLTPRMVSM